MTQTQPVSTPSTTEAAALQPLLSDELIVVTAPTQVWSSTTGEVGGSGIHGLYHCDTRIFSSLRLTVGGDVPEPIAHSNPSHGQATFISLLRGVDDRTTDPRVRLIRERTVGDGLLTERFTVQSALDVAVETVVRLEVVADFAEMQTVKAGLAAVLGEIGLAPGAGPDAAGRAAGDAGGRADGRGAGHGDGHADGCGDGYADGHGDGHADGRGDGHADGRGDGHADAAEVLSIHGQTGADASIHFELGAVRATLSAPDAAVGIDHDHARTTLSWAVRVEPHAKTTVEWSVTISDDAAVVSAAPALDVPWSASRAAVASNADSRDSADSRLARLPHSAARLPHSAAQLPHNADPRLARWLDRALDDLEGLRMVTKDAPGEPFLAAGAPWFFTLFGRDSLWAARFLIPVDVSLAASTLRVLAGLQGQTSVDASAEQPGKIMHELRPRVLTIPGENVFLPPLYYGTIDATALWIIVLHDAWKAGMPEGEVRALLPNLEAALAWMRDCGDTDGDGFLEYVDTTGHGLANQGWKDSGDSIQWRDGSLADGPIALCEVQGYAYEAAIGGAELLEHFGSVPSGAFGASGDFVDSGASGASGASEWREWREWAAALKGRFAESFWIDDPAGRYPAVALDAAKRQVDTVTSNIGHLLGTGILNPGEAELIAARLTSPELDSGFGLRTMSSDSDGYWPLSYHGGSVWTHDTAIAIEGLGREGLGASAAGLIEGLLRAAEGFGYRMPELHSGDSAAEFPVPVPYPAACRPQAWSAAAAVSVLTTTRLLSAAG